MHTHTKNICIHASRHTHSVHTFTVELCYDWEFKVTAPDSICTGVFIYFAQLDLSDSSIIFLLVLLHLSGQDDFILVISTR